MVYRICDGFRHFENDWWQPNNNTRGGRQQKGRWEKRGQEVGEGGEGGGSWVTEGWEVGEEKFVKWEKTDPPSPQKKCE